ncbi:hypothetical protein QYF36_003382 [Acer negundo]|nr:hypothetical protein QYF36_003382 [Acer negundo]
MIQPSISAPGVNILVAYSPIAPISASTLDKCYIYYNVRNFHVTGVVAYVKTFHLDWSPSAIKSAIMTTAQALVMKHLATYHEVTTLVQKARTKNPLPFYVQKAREKAQTKNPLPFYVS